MEKMKRSNRKWKKNRNQKKFVCDFGVFKGKTMEQVLESGVKGTETMKWIVNKYKGPNKELVKAAKTLLDYQSESEELRAA